MDTLLPVGSLGKAGAIVNQRVAVQAPLQLAEDTFKKGFSQYAVTGQLGALVAEGAQVDVNMPVLRLNEQARNQATGSHPSDVLEKGTPPLYIEDPVKATLHKG